MPGEAVVSPKREREKETPGVKKNRVGRDAAGKQNGETA